MKKIALISTPWPLFNRPSIQLAALKAFLKERLPDTKIDNLHIYLDIAYSLGYDLYNKLSQSSWLSEPLYGALLYPERIKTTEKLWDRYARSFFKKDKPQFSHICDTIKQRSQFILNNIEWDSYFLIGFSICFSQVTSSLYFIKEIKKRVPDIKIVIGGSSCSGNMGKSLLDTFQEIDYAIQGEGELPLYYLISCLSKSEEVGDYPGIISRSHHDTGISQIKDLNELPTPDYSDYFKQARIIAQKMLFQIKLPVEISRGCWWGRCRFCNLNIQWKGYRSKSSKKIIDELKNLSARYEILSISFMDNLLPPHIKELFEQINTIQKDFRFFAEIRAKTSPDTIQMMAKAGMKEVQVGIESLSSSLLEKMGKGATAMDNIEIMKNCEAEGMPGLRGNLILYFPGSNEEDVKETLRNMDFVLPFYPLKGIPFWLGYGSYVWKNPSIFSIKRTGNHRNYSYIFPASILNRLILIIQGYSREIRKQQKIWRPVREKLISWKNFYMQLHQPPQTEPILSYQDGGDFLIIRQRIAKDKNVVHKLRGLSRKIFLFCEQQRSIQEILACFKGLDELKLLPFLKMMVEKRLMFSENSRYLSLAVPVRMWK